MNINFFDWLRDGVRQSVVMGVSDAVEQIGVPDSEQTVNPELAALIGEPAKKTAPKRRPSGSATGTAASRKRLGKSLSDMDGDTSSTSKSTAKSK